MNRGQEQEPGAIDNSTSIYDVHRDINNKRKVLECKEDDIRKARANIDEIDVMLDPLTSVEFQKYAKDKATVVFGKYFNLYSADYNQYRSLDYPLYRSKRGFYANKIFDILHLKDQDQSLMTELKGLIDDLKCHDNDFFNEDCQNF